MKKKLFITIALFVSGTVLYGCQNGTNAAGGGMVMKVTSSGISAAGVIADKYGVNGGEGALVNGIPSISLPLKIENAPKGAVSYAVVIDDYDAFPVSHGFAWVHWAAANITDTDIPENASRNSPSFVQGVNSWWSPQGGSQSPDNVSYYGGMYPPAGDGEHIYNIRVYALDKKLDLTDGFYLNKLYRAMDGHILAEAVLKGAYANKAKAE